MTLSFDSDGQRVLALISCISSLSAEEADRVASVWRRGDAAERARAWARLNQAATEADRYRILAASALARREALETARRLRRTDWAFWAAACDAGAGVAAGAWIGRHYDTLVAPFAEVMPALAHSPAAPASADYQSDPDVPAKSA
jgi:multidrug resistance efflux pump